VYVPVGPVHRVPPAGMVVVEPRLVLIEGLDVRYCPDLDDDVFFYGGVWYTYRSGGWYWCGHYGEPWIFVERGRLPAVFIQVPPGQFKHRYSAYHPAHEHHPDLDTWGGGNDKDRGRGGNRGRGNGRGRGRDD
jgi:hypothetical protein